MSELTFVTTVSEALEAAKIAKRDRVFSFYASATVVLANRLHTVASELLVERVRADRLEKLLGQVEIKP